MRRETGFTLIELMIVVAIIAIIAAIAIPNLLSARLNSNETAAIATLRTLSTSQAQFQATAKADTDINGMGEYGSFRELTGDIPVRYGTMGVLDPAILSASFRNPNANGAVSRSGYFFKMILPGPGGIGICPDETNSFAGVQSGLAETTWCCYAWPVNHGNSGSRTFMVNQRNDVVYTDSALYTGGTPPLLWNAAFTDPTANSITGDVAMGTTGADGNVWRQVN